ncbi:MAG: glycosyltransferase, partial [Planctomycetota bacterium]
WVYHVHSPSARDSTRAFQNRINAWIEYLSLLNCQHLITVSNSLRQMMLQQGFAENRVTTVHNGVPARRPQRRRNVPTASSDWLLSMVALMRPRKGLEVAIDAIALLKERGLMVTLRCIGDFETDEYKQGILRQIEARSVRDQIQLTGFVSDVPDAIAQTDAMILPSLFGEGLPMVVLESMAAGTPIIATDVEGTPEAVRHGVEGLLAKPQNAESLSDAIQQMVRGDYDWQTMAEAAVTRHRDHFSDVAMTRGVADIYRTVLDAKPAE